MGLIFKSRTQKAVKFVKENAGPAVVTSAAVVTLVTQGPRFLGGLKNIALRGFYWVTRQDTADYVDAQ